MRDKGLYHINAADELTQWEMVAAMPQIGNSTAAVYPLMANGDVPPLRLIRSARLAGENAPR